MKTYFKFKALNIIANHIKSIFKSLLYKFILVDIYFYTKKDLDLNKSMTQKEGV